MAEFETCRNGNCPIHVEGRKMGYLRRHGHEVKPNGSLADRLFRVAVAGRVPHDDQHVVADAQAEIERMSAALWKCRQFFEEDMDGAEDNCGNVIVAEHWINIIDTALGR